MKNFIKLFAVVGVLALPMGTKAEFTPLSVFGLAKTIYDKVVGETTITPSYDINTWDVISKRQDVFGGFEKRRYKVRFDIPTRTHIYKTEIWYADTTQPNSTSTGFFPMSDVELWNWNCTDSDGEVRTVQQSYSIVVTCQQTTTGMVGFDGPFDISFKTEGTMQAKKCNDTNFGSKREFRKSFGVKPYGFVTGVVGVPNYSFAYPFQCWAGYIYLY